MANQTTSQRSDAEKYCTTKIWQAKAPTSVRPTPLGQGRYLWIDVNADCPVYGPLTKGSGTVIPASLPQKSKIAKMMSDVATFIHHSTKLLISPPILSMRPSDWTELEVRLIMIHDHKVGIIEESERFDWEAIKEQIRLIKLLPHQSISFSKTEISLLDNVYAAQAKQSSLRTHHSGTKGTQQYLDSKDLHYWFDKHNLKFVPDLDYKHDQQDAYLKISSLQELTSNLTQIIHDNHRAKHSFLDCKQPTIIWSETISLLVTGVLVAILTRRLLKLNKK
eukprot:gene7462-8731_t